jgi:molybdopterin-guanine dinucleotide biosynthesis protein A
MGQAKAWLPFGGKTMLVHVVEILEQVARPIVVVAAPDQNVPPLPHQIRLARDEKKGLGPLQGLAVGLANLAGLVDAAYVSSCDVPFVKPALIWRLKEMLQDDWICVPRVADRYHPLAAVYRPAVLPFVRRLLDENRLRPAFLFEEVPTRIATAEDLVDIDPDFRSLQNVNTPEEYAAALAEWEGKTQ